MHTVTRATSPLTPSVPRLAVVGHTNVGKTSLLRTLLRDAGFGEVAATSGTTRQVESACLTAAGQPAVALFDTPGMEDASALIEALESMTAARHGGPERIAEFLGSALAHGRFEQEARVLGQLIDCDAGLYVIDAREPVLGKYQDELAILAMCARPILPVLNFVALPGHRANEWREALARVGLHTLAEFDNHVFSLDAEVRLWQRLATLLDRFAPSLEALIEERRDQSALRYRAALQLAAAMLVDVTAACRFAPSDDPVALDRARRELIDGVIARNRRVVADLLELYGFHPDLYPDLPLPLDAAAWSQGPIDRDRLLAVGRDTGRGAAAGAATGAALDLALGGLSLGTATLIGALTGGGLGSAWQWRDALGDRLRGRRRVVIDDRAAGTLASRALDLIAALEQRGHASESPVHPGTGRSAPWPADKLPEPLREARANPRISSLNASGADHVTRREELARRLVQVLDPVPSGGGDRGTG